MSILGIKMQQITGLYKNSSKSPTKIDKKSNITMQKDEFIPSGQSNNISSTDCLNNPMRTAKLAKIAENITSGTYQINYGAVAGMLLDASEA